MNGVYIKIDYVSAEDDMSYWTAIPSEAGYMRAKHRQLRRRRDE